MSRLDKSCKETVCIKSNCPFKGTTILCNNAFANPDMTFKEVIVELEDEIKKVKDKYEKENQDKK